MHRIFLGIAIWIVLIFAAEFGIGIMLWLALDAKQIETAQSLLNYHMLGGIFLATLVCVIHVMTMFHFIGSGKEIKEAVEVLGGDADVLKQLRRFKMQTSGIATLAPLITGAAVILGGGAHTKATATQIHWALGILALAVNLAAFWLEYRALKANLALINEIDARLKSQSMPALPERTP